jgi:hypothetical protein
LHEASGATLDASFCWNHVANLPYLRIDDKRAGIRFYSRSARAIALGRADASCAEHATKGHHDAYSGRETRVEL